MLVGSTVPVCMQKCQYWGGSQDDVVGCWWVEDPYVEDIQLKKLAFRK